MDDDRPDDDADASGQGPRKRPPPTIDLAANDFSDHAETARDTAAGADEAVRATWRSRLAAARTLFRFGGRRSRALWLWRPPLIGGVVGALVAALVLAGAWWSGWVPAREAVSGPAPDVAALEARLARLETEKASAPAPSPAPDVTARLDALDKSVAALRDTVSAARDQAAKAAAALDDIKAAPREAPQTRDEAAAPDLSAIEERLARLERAASAEKPAPAPAPAPAAPPADDARLRRVAAATSLDAAVRQGEPYAAALAAAKASADDTAALKPLETFAAAGVPSAHALSRELLALLPSLAPKEPQPAADGGLVARLQQSAMRLVRIRRVDDAGDSLRAVLARVEAAAQRDDIAEARRLLLTLPATERGAAQPWLDKAEAREQALAAARQFAADTVAALSRTAR